MRSASMPLFGFEETRIRGSRSDTRDLRPLAFHRAECARQALLETLGGAFGPQAFDDEDAEALVDLGARVAVGAEQDVRGEVLLLGFGEGAVEEEVDRPFYIVTKHSSSFPSAVQVTTSLRSTEGGRRRIPAKLFPKKRTAARRPPLHHVVCCVCYSTATFSSASS